MAITHDYNPIPIGGEAHYDTLSRAFPKSNGDLQETLICCGVPYSLDVVDDNVVAAREGPGTWSFKFFRHANDPTANPNGTWNRTTTYRAVQNVVDNSEIWYGASWQPSAANTQMPSVPFHTLVGWHTNPTPLGEDSHLSMQYYSSDRLHIYYRRENTSATHHVVYDQSNVMPRGEWTDLVTHVKLDPTGTNGLLEIWLNGTQIVNLQNISIGFVNDEPFLSQGTYMSWSVPWTRTFYMSRVRVVIGPSSYAEVAPRVVSGGAPTVGNVAFTRPGQIFTGSIGSGLSCANSDRIIYTLDGTPPSGGGDTYSASLSLASTTWVRARGESDTLSAGPSSGQVYVRSDPVSAYTPITRNCGSAPAYAHFNSDSGFSDGAAFGAGGYPVAGTQEDNLYTAKRIFSAAATAVYGPFVVPNGEHIVFAHMSVGPFSALNNFNIKKMEVRAYGGGVTQTMTVDFFEPGADQTAFVRKFGNIIATNGQLLLHFAAINDTAEISAFEILSQGILDQDPPAAKLTIRGAVPTQVKIINQEIQTQAPQPSQLSLFGVVPVIVKRFHLSSPLALSSSVVISGKIPTQVGLLATSELQEPSTGVVILAGVRVEQAAFVSVSTSDDNIDSWGRSSDAPNRRWRRRHDSVNK